MRGAFLDDVTSTGRFTYVGLLDLRAFTAPDAFIASQCVSTFNASLL
jgi:hypothetical protein